MRYMWVYHMYLAGWKIVSEAAMSWTVGMFNVVNAFIFPYLIARITSCFTKRNRYILAVPLFSIAGLESASWVLWPVVFVRSLFGDVKGLEEVSRIIGNIDLNSNRVVHFLSPHGTWMVNLIDKYFVITPFNYTLNMFLLCFFLVLSQGFYRHRSKGLLASVFLVCLGAFFFHVIIGTALILSVIGSGILIAVYKRVKAGERVPVRHSVLFPIAAACAAAIGFPYLASLMGSGEGGSFLREYLQIGTKSICTIAAPLCLLFFPARAALKEVFTSDRDENRILATWLVCLLVLSMFVNLPMRNESKLIFPLFLLLMLPIARKVIDGIGNTRGAIKWLFCVYVVLLLAVPPVMTVRAFFLERPTHPIEVRRAGVTEQERWIFEWIRENTVIEAVVMESNDYVWMPVYAHRRCFFPRESAISVFGFGGEKVERYRSVRKGMFSHDPVSPEDLAFLAAREFDIFIVVWKEDFEAMPYLRYKFDGAPGLVRKVHENPGATIYRAGGL